jgi:hypothetical protein
LPPASSPSLLQRTRALFGIHCSFLSDLMWIPCGQSVGVFHHFYSENPQCVSYWLQMRQSGNEKCIQNFGQKTSKEESPLWRPVHGWMRRWY